MTFTRNSCSYQRSPETRNEGEITIKKVFISAGHGGSDPGACANGFQEKALNLMIALACRDELMRHGIGVLMSRETDANDPVYEEVKECNKYRPDLAVSIHNNAGGGDGAEAFHHHGGGLGKTAATYILDEITKLGQASRGAKMRKNGSGNDYYYFIRETTDPAVIVECAFVDNKDDIKIIDTLKEQKAMGTAVARGILKALGVAYISEASKAYRVQVGYYEQRENAEAMLQKLKAAGYAAIIKEEVKA